MMRGWRSVHPQKAEGLPTLQGVDKQTLFFALTELPYVTYLYGKKAPGVAARQ